MTTRSYAALRGLLLAGALSTAIVSAQTPSYFPLQQGNVWVYRPASGTNGGASTFRTISVDGQETVAGRQYFDVNYLGRQVLLREDPAAGTIIAYDRVSGAEQPWLSLRLPEGGTFPTTLDSCTATGTIVSRSASLKTPAGTFENAVQVGYAGPCADAGTTTQYYAPYIGLVSHEETSFAGPRKWELTYYHTASASGSGPEVSFTMGLDAQQYQALSPMTVRLTLRSSLPDPLELTFPSGQSYDLKVYDASGAVVYTWSSSRAFPMIFRQQQFGPGEMTYLFTADLPNLPAGHYQAQGYLTTQPVQYVGEVSFDIGTPGAAAADRAAHGVSSKSRAPGLRH